MAHLDTVSSTRSINPVLKSGLITSDGTTILGADDRAGVAVILHVLETLAALNGRHRSVQVVFSVAEELGMFGSSRLNSGLLKAREGYILDCSRPVGCYVARTPTAVDIQFEFTGKASHSGVAIENGINAISMALEVLADFPVGRVDPDTTANIGTIQGGTAVNVVPEKVTAKGEIRSFNPDRIEALKERLQKKSKVVAEKYRGKAKIDFTVGFKGFHLKPDLPVIKRLESVCQRLDISTDPLVYYGGSDANVMNGMGIQAVNLGIGVKNPHSKNEQIAMKDLVSITEVVTQLILGNDL
jgi:tripeptide aminopeptidase